MDNGSLIAFDVGYSSKEGSDLAFPYTRIMPDLRVSQ
jgi:hypothetical protein